MQLARGIILYYMIVIAVHNRVLYRCTDYTFVYHIQFINITVNEDSIKI